MKEKVRVAGGQGFWGDLLSAPVDQVRRGPIDYLMLDYLAEVTMSILQKQRSRDPNAGYARDFVSLVAGPQGLSGARVFSLADGRAAFERLAGGEQFGKIVIRVP